MPSKTVTPPLVISITSNPEEIKKYLMGLSKGSLLAYSSAILYSDLMDLVKSLGMEVSVLPEKHPLRKKYGKYVMKVVIPYKNQLVRTWVGNVHHYERTAARGTRKCKGPGCSHMISKGDLCLEVYELASTPQGRTCYKKTTLCVDCAIRHVKTGIETLIDVLPLNIPKSSITISFNPKIQLSRTIQ